MGGLSEEPKNSSGRVEVVLTVLLVISASDERGFCDQPAETNREHIPAVRSTAGSSVCSQPLPLYFIHKKYPEHAEAEHVQSCHSLSNS